MRQAYQHSPSIGLLQSFSTSPRRLQGVVPAAETLPVQWIKRVTTIATFDDVVGEEAGRGSDLASLAFINSFAAVASPGENSCTPCSMLWGQQLGIGGFCRWSNGTGVQRPKLWPEHFDHRAYLDEAVRFLGRVGHRPPAEGLSWSGIGVYAREGDAREDGAQKRALSNFRVLSRKTPGFLRTKALDRFEGPEN